MMKTTARQRTAGADLAAVLAAAMLPSAMAQSASDYGDDIVRISRITVDAAQLESYKAFLKEEAEASMRIEPGVRFLYAMSEKKDPIQFTIVEIYDNQAAYQSHLKTPHFLKYKNGTIKMVKSLELVDMAPLSPEMMLKLPVAGSGSEKR